MAYRLGERCLFSVSALVAGTVRRRRPGSSRAGPTQQCAPAAERLTDVGNEHPRVSVIAGPYARLWSALGTLIIVRGAIAAARTIGAGCRRREPLRRPGRR